MIWASELKFSNVYFMLSFDQCSAFVPWSCWSYNYPTNSSKQDAKWLNNFCICIKACSDISRHGMYWFKKKTTHTHTHTSTHAHLHTHIHTLSRIDMTSCCVSACALAHQSHLLVHIFLCDWIIVCAFQCWSTYIMQSHHIRSQSGIKFMRMCIMIIGMTSWKCKESVAFLCFYLNVQMQGYSNNIRNNPPVSIISVIKIYCV